MRDEIESAANFLSDLLRLHAHCLAPQTLENFRLAVIDHLSADYQFHWHPEQPVKGSGYRCLRINHKMDPTLARVGQLCGLSSAQLRQLFPNELTLWIDPREVSYRIGENGSICTLYGQEMTTTTPRSTPSPTTSNLSSSPSSSPSQWLAANNARFQHLSPESPLAPPSPPLTAVYY